MATVGEVRHPGGPAGRRGALFAARSTAYRVKCGVLARQQAFRMFLGVGGEVGAWSEDKAACTLALSSNPLARAWSRA